MLTRFRNSTPAVLLTLILIAQVLICQSQPSLPKTLLWRISGKGTGSSYIYGTMHLNDKRLFTFGDSVYHALEKSSGFALEINPEELAAYFVNKMVDDMQSGTRLKDVLNERDFRKYEARLSKKFKRSADEITTQEIIKEKNKWISQVMKNGEMPTFVDAYLYDIAKRQAKWIGGIEDLADQAGLLDDNIDKTDLEFITAETETGQSAENRKMLNGMIAMYTGQDITAMEKISGSGMDKDQLLTRRNIKMARRMDSLTNIRTMFFAIGAAHLAGDSGVIALLRAKGLKVEPVISTAFIPSTSYKFTEVPQPWSTVIDKQQLYQVDMPGNPVSLKMHGLMDMEFLLDLTSLSCYASMAAVGVGNTTNSDSLIQAIVANIFKSGKLPKAKNITTNGVQGKEFVQTLEDGALRVQLFVRDRVLYMLMVSSMKKANLTSANAEKFLASLVVKEKSHIAQPNLFTVPSYDLRFLSPTDLRLNEQMTRQSKVKDWNTAIYSGVDLQNGAYTLVVAKSPSAGNYISSDSTVLVELDKFFSQQYDQEKFETIRMQGYNGRKFSGRNRENHGIHTRAVSVVRGNKHITVMVIGDSSSINGPVYNDLFQSIVLLPYQRPAWAEQQFTDAGITAWSPANISVYNDSESGVSTAGNVFKTVDTLSSTSFIIMSDTLSRYTREESDSIFLRKGLTDKVSGNDSIIHLSTIAHQGMPSLEILYRKENSATYERFKRIRFGKITYTLIAAGDREVICNADADRFYSSFSLLKPVAPFELTTSKTSMLLEDLASADSVTRADAYEALGNLQTNEQDLPELHNALFRSFPPLYEWDSDSMDVNSRVGVLISKFNHPGTTKYIRQRAATCDNEGLRNNALLVLAAQKTGASYQALAELISSIKPTQPLPYLFGYYLRDSLALTRTIFPSLAVFMGDSILGPLLCATTVRLLDSGMLDISSVRAQEKAVIRLAGNRLRRVKKIQDNEADYEDHQLIALLEQFGTPEALAAIKPYLQVTDKSLVTTAIIALLNKRQVVPPSAIQTVAASPLFRSSLYRKMKDAGHLRFFPVQYRTAQQMAMANAFVMGTDDAMPSSIKFIGEKTGTVEGKKYRFYLFRLTYEGENESSSYLAAYGGYALSGNSPEPLRELGGIYWEETFDPASLADQFQAILEENK